MPKTNCDFCENTVYFIDENNEAYCLRCVIEVNESQQLLCQQLLASEQPQSNWVRARCVNCEWSGYTDNLDDACYDCGEYETLKEIPPDCNKDANHAEFC